MHYYNKVVYCVCGDLVQDGWTSSQEVTLKDMTGDEQYDPDTVYGEWWSPPAFPYSSALMKTFNIIV